LEARRAGRRRSKGWAAAGPQRPAYSGRGHNVSPRAQLVAVGLLDDLMIACRWAIYIGLFQALTVVGGKGDFQLLCIRSRLTSFDETRKL